MNTPVTPLSFRGRTLYIKRDDLISDYYPGNKYRKLYSLVQIQPSTYKSVISYGGSQSNAMVAIAHLAHQKGWKFRYYLKTLPKWLKDTPTGNFAKAIELGMQYEEILHADYDEYIKNLEVSEGEIIIPQGGAANIAKEGIEKLSQEILKWKKLSGVETFYVATPSGTGTTAFFLAQTLQSTATVLTTPLVSDAIYLKEQWSRLEKKNDYLPKIIETKKKYNFAKPDYDFLKIWQELQNSGLEFDLIYAPKMWLALIENQFIDANLLYIHSGGISGNSSQLQRYELKNS